MELFFGAAFGARGSSWDVGHAAAISENGCAEALRDRPVNNPRSLPEVQGCQGGKVRNVCTAGTDWFAFCALISGSHCGLHGIDQMRVETEDFQEIFDVAVSDFRCD
jgi:hypothetical protein